MTEHFRKCCSCYRASHRASPGQVTVQVVRADQNNGKRKSAVRGCTAEDAAQPGRSHWGEVLLSVRLTLKLQDIYPEKDYSFSGLYLGCYI